jgi:hypothetical protein
VWLSARAHLPHAQRVGCAVDHAPSGEAGPFGLDRARGDPLADAVAFGGVAVDRDHAEAGLREKERRDRADHQRIGERPDHALRVPEHPER